MNVKHAYLAAFVLAVGVISYNDVKKCHRLPFPPRLIYAGMVFAILDLFSAVNEELPAVIAIGVTLAILVNHGFVSDCQQAYVLAGYVSTTGQPTDTSFLVSPTPTNPTTSQGSLT